MRNVLLEYPHTRPIVRSPGALGLLALIALGACATGPKPPPVDALVAQARQECARLRETTLPRPVQTPVDAGLAELERLVADGQDVEAAARARSLTGTCNAEADQRSGLLALSAEVEALRARLDARRYAQFRWLAGQGDYGSAIFCGQALLRGEPGGCEGAPVAADALAAAVRAPGATMAPPPRRAAIVHDWDATEGDDDAAAPTATSAVAPPPGALGLRRRATRAPSRSASWVAFGTSAAALVAGAVLAGMATKRHGELDDRCPDCSRAEIDGGKRLALGADVAFGVGLSAAITGLVLWWVGSGSGARMEPQPSVVGRPGPGLGSAPRLDFAARRVGAGLAF